MSNTSLEQLQSELITAVNVVPPDVDLIQELTNKIARLDTDNVRFTIDAGIISRLGQELVGKQETAVAELIKNAYDADATEVRIVFNNTDTPGGTLRIEDNGLGMTREQLLNGFMRLSSNDKLINPLSERYHRRRAGKKGIGRFAVQRLGEELILTTQTESSAKALRVTVNWESFRAGRDLSTITSRVEEIDKELPFGTILFIKNLREAWSNAEQRRVYRYVSELLQPYALTKFKIPSLSSNSKVHPGELGRFDVELIHQSGEKETVVASKDETIFANALGVIEGYVDEKGHGIWSIESKKLGISEETSDIGLDRENKIPFQYLRNVSLKAYYYIWNNDLFPKLLFSTLQEIGRQQGGIRIFRNGFRVSPYGDRDNDWLELDASYAARRFLPAHANSNFIGLIELNDIKGHIFEERASREGLIENDAFKELQKFAYGVLTAGILRIAESRNKKQTAGQTNWKNKDNESPAETLKGAADKIRNTVAITRERLKEQSNHRTKENQTDSIVSVIDTFEKLEVAVAAQQAELDELVKVADVLDDAASRAHLLIQENQMLRVLASLGLLIGEFTHEIVHVLGSAQQNADSLGELLVNGTREQKAFDHLGSNISRLRGYLNFFYQTIASNASRELVPQNLRAVGRQFEESMGASIKRSGITFEFEPLGYELFTPPMHASEINSLLLIFTPTH
ncbi:ATP-binding protein [Hymenobacter sp. APR13]|uniref:ATP-binding protein n=1 Tax=Hymenobacter sp. APR13 TaxID=1356852 RepID=UPI0009DECD33|nr:ATP-binding protein [Hymenobacter sp. APR13]